VFCANDLLAVGFMQAVLMFSDLSVPADIAIVGYDDIDYAFSTIVPLTSVRQPAELLGRTAVETLLQENASDLVTPTTTANSPPSSIVRGIDPTGAGGSGG
jgi:LacI family transcriptional regulator